MTKKDYILIAGAIKGVADLQTKPANRELVANVAEFLANALQSDNTRFDKVRFLEACNPSELCRCGASELPTTHTMEQCKNPHVFTWTKPEERAEAVKLNKGKQYKAWPRGV